MRTRTAFQIFRAAYPRRYFDLSESQRRNASARAASLTESVVDTMYTPDYVRCGSSVYIVTWPRLIVWSLLISSGALMLSAYDEFVWSNDDIVPAQIVTRGGHTSDPDDMSLSASAAASKPLNAAPKLKKTRNTGLMHSWCTARSSTYYLSKWKLASLGATSGSTGASSADGWPSESQDQQYCDWLEATSTEVKFRMCTYDRTADTQISAYIHKEGFWNNWKRGLVEEMLPRIREGTEGKLLNGRILVLDLGSNIGFYTLLAATRGYDVISIEACKDSIIRQLYSLAGNGIRVAKSGREVAKGSGALRKPVVYVYHNAASDTYSSASLEVYKDNPGANYVPPASVGNTGGSVGYNPGQPAGTPSLMTVYVDDLLPAKYKGGGGGGDRGGDRGAGGGKGHAKGGTNSADAEQEGDVSSSSSVSVSTAPVVDPSRVRLVKISIEGMDSRALHGMRKLLSYGKIPFIIFVYNDAHVRNQGWWLGIATDVRRPRHPFVANTNPSFSARANLY